LNLLVIDQFSEPGGGQLCLLDLLPGMLKRGWNIHLMVPGQGLLARAAAAYGIATQHLPLSKYASGHKTALDILRFGMDLPRAAALVRAAVRKYDVDTILVNGPRALPAAAAGNRPIVFYAHSALRKRYAHALASWSLWRPGAMVIAPCRFAADSWNGLVNPAQAHVVYTGVADLQASARPAAGGTVRVGLIGRIAPEKGHLDFIQAARRVAGRCGNVRFVVCGSALFSGSEYEQEVRRMSEGAPVEFQGWVEDPRDLLRQVDMVAVPSMPHDAAPRVVMEAMSAGKPIIAYRSGGIPELIENGESGVLTDARTPESLADAISQLVRDPGRMARLSRQARQAWEQHFTIERYRRNICELLERA
jgi:glycosyltransferase involved in cell wall biosynthesis